MCHHKNNPIDRAKERPVWESADGTVCYPVIYYAKTQNWPVARFSRAVFDILTWQGNL